MTCLLSGRAPGSNSTNERNEPSLEICRSTNGRPESSSRSVGASRNPSFSLYHSRIAARFLTSIAQLSAITNGGLPHMLSSTTSLLLDVSSIGTKKYGDQHARNREQSQP